MGGEKRAEHWERTSGRIVPSGKRKSPFRVASDYVNPYTPGESYYNSRA